MGLGRIEFLKPYTNVKGSINFPIGFFGQKPTVKNIGFLGVMLALLIRF